MNRHEQGIAKTMERIKTGPEFTGIMQPDIVAYLAQNRQGRGILHQPALTVHTACLDCSHHFRGTAKRSYEHLSTGQCSNSDTLSFYFFFACSSRSLSVCVEHAATQVTHRPSALPHHTYS